MEEEIWRDIKGFEGKYQISNLGNIKSLNYMRTGKEKLLKKGINGRGYYFVNVTKNNKYKNLLMHQEVAKAFIKNEDSKKTDINHKDGNKLNNNVSNLEWCTRSENILHAYKNGLAKSPVGHTYKKRCEMAIKYIHEHQLVFELSSKKQIQYWFDEFYRDLLNILNKGSDK